MERIYLKTIEAAVQRIIPYLEDTSATAHSAIYFDGWSGLAASAVLGAIVEHPPRSLLKKFNKIVRIDCSRWKSRRALQRAIAEELKLPQRVLAIFDRHDAEDDFSGVDEGSRTEILDVGLEIYRALQDHRCLVVFHNGSDSTVHLNDFGITLSVWSGIKVLWTFRGRLRLNPRITEKVDSSHLHLYDPYINHEWDYLLQKEAEEIVRYMDRLDVTLKTAMECCLYLLSLNERGGNIVDYNWAIHAANYWVCDGIVQGVKDDDAWAIGTALQQQIHLEDYSSNELPSFGDELKTPPKRWICVTNLTMEEERHNNTMIVPPESTSFFLALESGSDPPLASLPNGMLDQSDKLHVLKLSHCIFSFSLPPFHCCRSLRFLGLDSCKDKTQEEVEKQERPATDFFQSLWVLDICNTDWALDLPPETIEKMAENLREVHIKKGRIWSSSLSWRQLRNLYKLRVIEPTCPWDTGKMDEFTDMLKLELLELSRNSTIHVLPSLSGATSLKTLVLDGCVSLEHVGPEGLPPSLESFSLHASATEEAKLSCISLAGCARLVKFRLRGSLPNLVELNLSDTQVKILDLKDEMVQVPDLRRIILLGCLQLHAILWPKKGLSKQTVLCIDSLVCHVQIQHHQAYATVSDPRFVLSLVLENGKFFCDYEKFHLNLCASSTTKGQSCSKDMTCRGQGTGPSLLESLIPSTYCTYNDVTIDKTTADRDYSSLPQLQPLGFHVEIGEGNNNINVESRQGCRAIILVMNKAVSLHVHNNSSITTVIPEDIMFIGEKKMGWHSLKWCRVERCPKLRTVFITNYQNVCFEELENFWAADLLTVRCIWSKGRTLPGGYRSTFANLRSIYLYFCPRLTFVLRLSWAAPNSHLPNLETLHIFYCGDLRQVFPVEAEFLKEIVKDHRKGILEFPKLKHIHLHELPRLHQICKAKMLAPKLETVTFRGCWSLRRLPAVGVLPKDSRPTVDCEKDWWEKLEWDGLEAGHDRSLFKPRHSRYYKKTLPRVSVLR